MSMLPDYTDENKLKLAKQKVAEMSYSELYSTCESSLYNEYSESKDQFETDWEEVFGEHSI